MMEHRWWYEVEIAGLKDELTAMTEERNNWYDHHAREWKRANEAQQEIERLRNILHRWSELEPEAIIGIQEFPSHEAGTKEEA